MKASVQVASNSLIKSTILTLYRVSQKERQIFWQGIVSVILNREMYMYMCPVANGFRDYFDVKQTLLLKGSKTSCN
jgi:hypothetical protein